MKVVLFFIALAATCISALTCGSNTCPSENACCNDFMMGPTCYDPKSHSCNTTITSSSGTTGYRLCGSGKVPCGAACYDQRDYFCCNGELKQNGQSCSSPQTSAPTSAPTSSPTSPATTSPTSAPTNAPTSSPSPVEATKSYSGTLDSGSSTWSFPKQSLLDGSCSFNSSVVVPYQTFEATFTTAGARAIEGLANGDLWRSLRIFVYSSQPSLSNPCAGLIRELLVNRGNYYLDTPLVHDWMFFSASTYYIVVTGGDGRFAFDISATTAAGQLTIDSSTPTWPQAYYSSSVDPYTQAISFGCSYYGSGSRTPFAQYSWTQDKDGIFDILVSGFFDTYSFSGDGNTNFSKIYMVLYDGAPSAAAISSNPCSAAKTLYSISSSVPGSFIPYVALTAGKTYTVVFGGNAFVPFSWVLRVIPTRVRMFGGDRWVEPRNQSPCAPNGQYWSRYFAFYVTARGNGPVLIDTSTQSGVYNWVSAFSYLYAGANTIPPQSCPTNATLVASQPGPSQGVLSFDGQPGKTYTVVVSPYDPNAYQPVPIANVEYIFGGTVLDRPVVSA